MDPLNTDKTHLGRPVPGKIPISAKGVFVDKDIYEQLKFAYAVSPRNTIRAFRKAGIIITGPEDLATLANLHMSGQDVAGFRAHDGKIIAFNVREIINRKENDPDRIKITKAMLDSAPFEFTDAYIQNGEIKII